MRHLGQRLRSTPSSAIMAADSMLERWNYTKKVFLSIGRAQVLILPEVLRKKICPNGAYYFWYSILAEYKKAYSHSHQWKSVTILLLISVS
jgi:hypothetical protein